MKHSHALSNQTTRRILPIACATALAMVREGARVAVADQTEAGAADTVAMINASGGQAIAIGADVADVCTLGCPLFSGVFSQFNPLRHMETR